MDRRSFLKIAVITATGETWPGIAMADIVSPTFNASTNRQIVISINTTGLLPTIGHRIIELACTELVDRKVTGKYFHQHINPNLAASVRAGSEFDSKLERLKYMPKFSEIASKFIAFIHEAEIIGHNALFAGWFLDNELEMAGLLTMKNHCTDMIDTLKIAKELHPGKNNNLNSLCERYHIDCSQNDLQGLAFETRLLAKVYLAMTQEKYSSKGFDLSK